MNLLWFQSAAAKLVAVAVIGLCIWFHGYGQGRHSGDLRVARIRAETSQWQAQVALETAKLSDKIRRQEQATADAVAEVAARYEDERYAIEQRTRDAVLADLRAGRIRLRVPAGCPVSAPGPPAGSSSVGDGEAEHRDEGAGDLAGRVADTIAVARAADAQLAACQSTLRAERQ